MGLSGIGIETFRRLVVNASLVDTSDQQTKVKVISETMTLFISTQALARYHQSHWTRLCTLCQSRADMSGPKRRSGSTPLATSRHHCVSPSASLTEIAQTGHHGARFELKHQTFIVLFKSTA